MWDLRLSPVSDQNFLPRPDAAFDTISSRGIVVGTPKSGRTCPRPWQLQ